MKRIYLIVAGALLVLLIIASMILSLGKKFQTVRQNNSPFPTGISKQGSTNTQITFPTDIQNNPTDPPVNISTIAPVETKDFKLKYSQTPQAGQNPDNFHPLLGFLNIFMNFSQSPVGPLTQNPTSNQPSLINNQLGPTTGQSGNGSQSLTYFPQCGDLGNLSLPNGCNLCQAGCGPTTVAMIAASYLGSSYNPKTIVDIYKSKGFVLGCTGSLYSDAKQVLQDLGLKTTDYLVFDAEKSDTVVPELKSYLNAGWTFFSMARFCDDSKQGYCGHFFWITDIDNQGNIWAYDPAYGRYEIPYNENSRYPFPLYRLLFGVKK